MRHIIEVEETVKIRHQIFVDVDTEEELDEVIEFASHNCLDDYIDFINEITPVVQVNQNYYEEGEGVEYFNDYPDDN